jgi:tRNA pseudouridine13 synthase
MGGRALSFFGAAAQSAVFNHALDERLRAGALDQLQAGDLAWVHRSRKVFVVDADELARPELDGRLRALEVSPSGPMWGSKMTMARASVLEGERAALQRFGLSEETLRKTPFELEGARRAMRARIEHSLVDSGFDEDGAYVRLAFELERGGFATTVLPEIMGEDGDRLDHRDDEGD